MQPQDAPLTPADAIAQAHADISTIPEKDRYFVRYLTMYSVPKEDRPLLAKVLTGHVNHLSRHPEAWPLVPVADGSLLRLDTRLFRWKTEVWEKLADPHFQEVLDWKGGVWPGDGKNYAAKEFKYRALGPWLTETPKQRQCLDELTLWTGSKIPVVHAEWFLQDTSISEGKAVGYFGFLEINDQKGFEAAVRFDEKLARELEHYRSVVFSGITLQPRRIEREATVLGGLWRTKDNEKAVGNKNPLKILDNSFEFEATEQIAPLPNGLPAFFLGNNKGKRQDKAPDQIVGGDRLGATNDTRLHIYLSCQRCHFGMVKAEMGVKEADYTKLEKLKVYDDFDKFLELSRQYRRDIKEPIGEDRVRYKRAIQRACGMEPQDYATELQKAFARYDSKVTPEQAAARLGTTKAKMIRAFRDYDAVADLDPVLSILMGDRPIPVTQFEEVISEAHRTLRGYKR